MQIGKRKPTPVSIADERGILVVQDLEVPNLWDGEFTTSTVIVAKSIEPLAAFTK